MKSAATYIFIGTLRGLVLRQFEVFSSFFFGGQLPLDCCCFLFLPGASAFCWLHFVLLLLLLRLLLLHWPWPRLTTRQATFDSFASLILVSFFHSPKKEQERRLTSYKTRCCLLFILVAAFSFFLASFSAFCFFYLLEVGRNYIYFWFYLLTCGFIKTNYDSACALWEEFFQLQGRGKREERESCFSSTTTANNNSKWQQLHATQAAGPSQAVACNISNISTASEFN